jgi:hypothetical protein
MDFQEPLRPGLTSLRLNFFSAPLREICNAIFTAPTPLARRGGLILTQAARKVRIGLNPPSSGPSQFRGWDKSIA